MRQSPADRSLWKHKSDTRWFLIRLLSTTAVVAACVSLGLGTARTLSKSWATSPAWTGTRTFMVPGSSQAIRALAVDPNGGLYAAGVTGEATGNTNGFLAHLTPTGDLDPNFGSGGITIFSNDNALYPNATDVPLAIVIVPSGVAVVSESYAPDRSAIDVFDPDTGLQTNTIQTPFEATAAAADGSGGIVVAGVVRTPYPPIAKVARYDPSLNQVSSFGTNGITTLSTFFDAVDVMVDHLGRPLVTASLGVARMTSAGALDATFGSGGIVLFGDGRLAGLTERQDGTLVAVANRFDTPIVNLVAGWHADGSLDTRFGTTGDRIVALSGAPVSRVVPFGANGFVVSTNLGLVRFDEYGAPTGARAAQLRSGLSDIGTVPLLRRNDGQYLYGWWEQALGVAQHQLHVTSQAISPVSADGYWMVSAAGTIYAFGSAPVPSLRPAVQVVKAAGTGVVKIAPTPSRLGGWIVWGDGRVASWGDAVDATPSTTNLVTGEKVTSLASSATGHGFILFTDRGRAMVNGDAVCYGDATGLALQGPVLDSVGTPSGAGYFMVASDGGIFSYGDAAFHGSMGDQRLNAPVRSLAPAPNGVGYWLVASDGGIFAFGPPFHGSMGDKQLNRPVVGMIAFGDGYLMVASDGGIFDFSSSPFFGSLGATPPPSPIVSVAAFLN
jgi:uncharacterized delta-60 repeat protein